MRDAILPTSARISCVEPERSTAMISSCFPACLVVLRIGGSSPREGPRGSGGNDRHYVDLDHDPEQVAADRGPDRFGVAEASFVDAVEGREVAQVP